MTVEELLKDRETKVKQEYILELLEEYGAIPEHIREAVLSQWNLTVLKKWHKLAAKAESMKRFEEEMKKSLMN